MKRSLRTFSYVPKHYYYYFSVFLLPRYLPSYVYKHFMFITLETVKFLCVSTTTRSLYISCPNYGTSSCNPLMYSLLTENEPVTSTSAIIKSNFRISNTDWITKCIHPILSKCEEHVGSYISWTENCDSVG